MLEKFHHFAHFFLFAFHSCHIGKGDVFVFVFVVEFGACFAYAKHAAAATTAHAAHHEDEEKHQQQKWGKRPKHGGKRTMIVVFHFAVKHACLAPLLHTFFKFVHIWNGGGNHHLTTFCGLIIRAGHL